MKLGKLLVVSSVTVLAVTAPAQVLLNIDLSNPAAVTITATSGLTANTASTGAATGIWLNQFFTSSAANIYLPQGVTSTLKPATPSGQVAGDTILSIQTSDKALNYYTYNDTGHNYDFTSGSTAFTGSTSAMNMSSVSSYFQSLNATGDIRVGSAAGTLIGQWQVVAVAAVPEPASIGLIAGLALGGFAFLRKRRFLKSTGGAVSAV